jgi:hypothetical protein
MRHWTQYLLDGPWFPPTLYSVQPPFPAAIPRRPANSQLSSVLQGERKGVNKYYPPDFNPEKVRAGSLPP